MSFTTTEFKITLSVATVFMVRMLGLFMVLPVLSLYATNLTHNTPTLMGLALGIYGLFQAFLQMPFGMLSDRIGRKPILWVGLITFFIGSIICAQSESIYTLIAGRALQGFGAIGSTLLAFLADSTSTDNRPKAMAIVGISIGLSFALSVVLGPIISEHWGLAALFYCVSIFSVLAMVIVYFLPEPTHHIDAGIQTPVAQQILSLFADTHLWRYNVGVMLIHAILASLFLVLPQELQLLAQAWQMPTWQIYLIALVISVFIMGSFLRRRGQTSPMMVAFFAVMLITGFVCTLLMKSQVLFIISLTIFFSAFNWLEAQLPALVSGHVPSNQRGTALGLFSTFQFLGIFVGGTLGGWMLEHYGTLALILLFCSIILIWAYTLIKLSGQRPHKMKN